MICTFVKSKVLNLCMIRHLLDVLVTEEDVNTEHFILKKNVILNLYLP